MIIKVLLSIGLGFIALLYLAHSRRRSFITLVALVGAGAGLTFVWHPQLANDVAEILGVGRGADLMFYCWVLISVALFLTIHFKLREMNQRFTEFVRQTALQEARSNRSKSGK